MNKVTDEDILKLIEAGIQAPSADNSQPWKFKILENGFELWLDHSKMGLFFDVAHVATLMSCGALIENVVTLADVMGLDTQISYFDEPRELTNESSRVARLIFTIDREAKDVEAVQNMIFGRHSDRNLFRLNQKILDTLISELTKQVETSQGYRLHCYQTPKDRNAIIRIITATDTIRFIHEQIHHDFYKMLRFGNTAEQTRDGLSSATLGIESLLLPILQRLESWSLTRMLNYIGLHHIMAFRGTWLPMKFSSLIVSIVHEGPADPVDSGRIIERFWLQANKAGLSVQALGALPLFLARLHLLHGEGFNSIHLGNLKTLDHEFTLCTPGFNKESDRLIMLFRLGFRTKPVTKAFRKPTETFLV